MTWHYLPVIKGTGDDATISLCEVYVDGEGRLEHWSKPDMTPAGDDVLDLARCLSNMLYDAFRWKPVPCADLKVGMTFERRES